jgi:hypothetical protein
MVLHFENNPKMADKPAKAMANANTECKLCMYDRTMPEVAVEGKLVRKWVAPTPTTALGSSAGTLTPR